MNGTVWAVTVTIIASAMLSFVGPVSNMADAYSCSNSTSTITGNSASIVAHPVAVLQVQLALPLQTR